MDVRLLPEFALRTSVARGIYKVIRCKEIPALLPLNHSYLPTATMNQGLRTLGINRHGRNGYFSSGRARKMAAMG